MKFKSILLSAILSLSLMLFACDDPTPTVPEEMVGTYMLDSGLVSIDAQEVEMFTPEMYGDDYFILKLRSDFRYYIKSADAYVFGAFTVEEDKVVLQGLEDFYDSLGDLTEASFVHSGDQIRGYMRMENGINMTEFDLTLKLGDEIDKAYFEAGIFENTDASPSLLVPKTVIPDLSNAYPEGEFDPLEVTLEVAFENGGTILVALADLDYDCDEDLDSGEGYVSFTLLGKECSFVYPITGENDMGAPDIE